MKLLQVLALALLSVRLAPGAKRKPLVAGTGTKRSGGLEVVVPARNEEQRLGACLKALSGEQVTIVDDESTDSTAALATDHGARVVTAPPLPAGWVGKPHALQTGLEASTREWVLFLDADVRVLPGFVDAALARAQEEQLNIVSFSAQFITTSVLHQSLQASLLSTLVYRFGPISAPTKRSPLINGQALLVKRAWLLNQGGFAIAPSNMTDDIALARALVLRGVHIGFVDASDLLQVAMFDSALETWTQWGRSLAMNDVSSGRKRLIDIAILFVTQVMPLLNVARSRASKTDYVLLAIRYALLIPFRKTMSSPGLGLALSPMLDAASFVRLVSSTLRPNPQWRGRTYSPSQTADQ